MDNTPTAIENEAPTAPIAPQTNAQLVFGLLTDFATITDERLRGALEDFGHSVWQGDGADAGLWFSCCSKTCHESREVAEKACANDFADQLADDADRASDHELTRASSGAREGW